MSSVELYATGIGTAVAIIGAVTLMAKDCGNKINKMYGRFDSHKRLMESNFVSDKVCKIINEQMREDILEIKSDVKELLKRDKGKV